MWENEQRIFADIKFAGYSFENYEIILRHPRNWDILDNNYSIQWIIFFTLQQIFYNFVNDNLVICRIGIRNSRSIKANAILKDIAFCIYPFNFFGERASIFVDTMIQLKIIENRMKKIWFSCSRASYDKILFHNYNKILGLVIWFVCL
jgi:hypothetical protein